MTIKIKTGSDDFHKLLMETDIFVDKSLFIEEFLEDNSEVLLLTRPRRWGKSMNMDMLGKFLQIEVDENGKELPQDKKIYDKLFLGGEVDTGFDEKKLLLPLKIAACQDKIKKYLGKYPVVRLNFKAVKENSYTKIESGVIEQVTEAFKQHRYLSCLLEGNALNKADKKLLSQCLDGYIPLNKLKKSVRFLTEVLFTHHGKKAYVLIDEYDSPINHAFVKLHDKNPDEFEEVLELFRGLFGEALKTNDYLEKGLVTGILRIAKADLFSGVNNFRERGVLDKQFSNCYGFNQQELEELLQQVPIKTSKEKIKEWYNGYNFSGEVLYNPWSIMNCLDNDGKTENYWINSGGTALLDSVLLSDNIQEELQDLISGKGLFNKKLFNQISFADIKTNKNLFYSLLVFAGYLNPIRENDDDEDPRYHLTIPNKEVRNIYVERVTTWVANKLGLDEADYDCFIELLVGKEMEDFTDKFAEYLLASTSYHDLMSERDYHNLLGGMFASLSNKFIINSNRESGHGRADHLLIPKNVKNTTAFILEYKVSKNETDDLKTLAEIGLKQIRDNAYFAKVKEYPHVKEIVCVSLAFYGKHFELLHKIEFQGSVL